MKNPKANRLLLTFYLGTVLNISIFLLVASYLTNITFVIGLIFLDIIIYILSFLLAKPIIEKVQKISIKNPVSLTQKQYFQFFSLFFLISFLIAFIWFLAYNPGGFSPDSINQYEQAISGEYSDWHPALHTFLFFTIPLSVFKNIAAIIICQILLFSFAIAYSTTTILEVAGKKWGLTTFLFIILNPWIFDELMFPWKDTAFGIMVLLISTISLKIYITKGAWIKKIPNLTFLAIIFTFATIFRHNGILFTIPAIVSLFFFIDHKNWLILFGISTILFFLIKIPFYSILNVTPPGGRTSESVGLPMTILANIAKEDPDSLNEETKDFLYAIAPAEKYKIEYIPGNFNSIKHTSNTSVIDDTGLFNIIKYAADASVKSPHASLVALFRLTDVVYSIDGPAPAYTAPYTVDNQYFKAKNNEIIKSGIDVYRAIFSNSILKYLKFIGLTVLIIIITILSHNRWSNGGWKKILLISPILFYDFGTMLLLTEPETRFFYLNLISLPTIIVLALKTNHKNKTTRHRL